VDDDDSTNARGQTGVGRLASQRGGSFDDVSALLPKEAVGADMGQLRKKLSRIVLPGSIHDARANHPVPEVQRIAEHVNQYDPAQQIWDFENRI
jgi:hypothetical protein